MRLAASIFAGIVLILWAVLLSIGIELIKEVAGHVSGAPTSDQITYYVELPAEICAALSFLIIVFNIHRMWNTVFAIGLIVLSMAGLFFLAFYFQYYTGGM